MVVAMHNLMDYGDSHLKTSGSLRQCYRDESALDNNNKIADFSLKCPNNRANKKRWNKKWWNNDFIKISK